MKIAVQKITGPLKTYTLEGRPGGACVVLFHGYGADATDLQPLADMSGVPAEVTWVFPEAPMEIIVAPGFYGKAWFQIDSRRLENSLKNGEPLDMSQSFPEGLAQAKKAVEKFYLELQKYYAKIIVGGFSQGAMLATDLFLSAAKKPDGLIILSGTVINQNEWLSKLTTAQGHSFFQSHGRNDALLGYDYAEKLNELLSGGGMYGEFVSFNGGHEIPPKVIQKMGAYINQIIKRK